MNATGQLPSPETCLHHLKFLHALHSLKEDVGYTDGLWGLWDTRINLALPEWENIDRTLHPSTRTQMPPDAERRLRLSKLREKRWALFVARAVDRYEAWWDAIAGPEPDYLVEHDTRVRGHPKYDAFPSGGVPAAQEGRGEPAIAWSESTLPPLGESLSI